MPASRNSFTMDFSLFWSASLAPHPRRTQVSRPAMANTYNSHVKQMITGDRLVREPRRLMRLCKDSRQQPGASA